MGTYVYGITRESHPLALCGLTGVGDQPAPVRAVRHGDIVAIVSDAPANLRAKRRDLETHEALLEQLYAAGTVLPMRFGMVAADDEAVQGELAAGAHRYRTMLVGLDGKVELNVKAEHDEPALLRDLLTSRRDLRERNDALRRSGGGTHDERVAFGELVAAAVERRRAEDADLVVARLRPHAARVTLGPAAGDSLVNASFLVGPTARSAFDNAVATLEREHGPVLRVRVFGPLPPYSFVGDGS
jgi:hypothetical protein